MQELDTVDAVCVDKLPLGWSGAFERPEHFVLAMVLTMHSCRQSFAPPGEWQAAIAQRRTCDRAKLSDGQLRHQTDLVQFTPKHSRNR